MDARATIEQLNYFKQLHEGPDPLLLGNAWDATSARLLLDTGFKAIGTSSAAIAKAAGYNDGEGLSLSEMLHVCENIGRGLSVPFTVDLEAGYSRDTDQICENVAAVVSIGAVGINLEDSIVTNGTRQLVQPQDFARILDRVRNFVTKKGFNLFINARSDAYLLNHPEKRKEGLSRASLYERSGADGIFMPKVTDPTAIRELVEAIKLPLNVLVVPGLPHFDALAEFGVKRISMGNALHSRLFAIGSEILQRVQATRSFADLTPG